MSRNENEVHYLQEAVQDIAGAIENIEAINGGELRNRALSLTITNLETGLLWLEQFLRELPE